MRTSSPMTARNCLSLYCAVEDDMFARCRRELSWAWGSLRLDSSHVPSVVIAQHTLAPHQALCLAQLLFDNLLAFFPSFLPQTTRAMS
jgi:hypothetical protein